MIDEIKISDCPKLLDVKIITHSQFEDFRGIIYSLYTKNAECEILGGQRFNHNKIALSNQNVLRGIHGDYKSQKLVSCLFGEVFQVVVDCREGSTTFGVWWSTILTGSDSVSILIPPGFGNAVLTLSDTSVYEYKLSYSGDYADADEQFTFYWDDPRFAINWPTKNPILSERDSSKK